MSQGVRVILVVFMLVVAIAVVAAIILGPGGRRGDEDGEGRREPPEGMHVASIEGRTIVPRDAGGSLILAQLDTEWPKGRGR